MRVNNSLKNISIVILTQLILALLGFLSRKVFLNSLGAQYLGINGLLDNVLSVLALVESGVGASITYSLYKPLAENNKPKIIALIQLYKKAYRVIAIIILLLSILLFPFIGNIIRNSGSVTYITIVYFIFVAKNMTSYFNAHKISLINTDQKGYILSRFGLGFQILTLILRIVILQITKNYILYLSIDLILTVSQAIFNGTIVSKLYPYIRTKEKYLIEQSEKDKLIKNIKALFLHNLGAYAVFGTDNILISTFVSVTAVGLYSNYTMIVGQLGSLISPLLSGLNSSIGNLIAMESKEKSYSIFKVTYLVNFWIYSVSVIFLYNLLEPFINWWLGNGYLLNWFTLIMILVNFYITGMRASISTFKTKAGIFVKDKYVPLLEGVINLVVSIILAKHLGLAGVILGTTISTLSTVFWVVPNLTYKYVFNAPVSLYYLWYFLYSLLALSACYVTTLVCNILVKGESFLSLIERGILCLIIPNLIYIVVFYKKKEFLYLRNLINNAFLSIVTKIKNSFYKNLVKIK